MHYNLRSDLEAMRAEAEKAARECGLDFYNTNFYVLDFEALTAVIANIGFPVRYSHWRFGMEYDQFEKKMAHGMQRIYELVINNDPSIAYLLEYNNPVQQKMVMAHVYGHVDFFKNNVMFKKTNRNMINAAADHARLIEKHRNKLGIDRVEEFIDACLSLEDLIDPCVRENKKPSCSKKCGGKCDGSCSNDEGEPKEEEQPLIKIDKYMEQFLDMSKFRAKKEEDEKPCQKQARPERDIFRFLMNEGKHLADWQKDILSIIRDEAYYFLPQRQTKIMNEGWATFWHDYMMIQKGLAGDQGLVDYAKTMAGVVSKAAGFNPYRLGYQLYHDIKERWDKGRHGREYLEEQDSEKKASWDTHEGLGMKKIFEVRASLDDAEFLREHLTDEFIEKEQFFEYNLDLRDNWYKISGRDPRVIRNYLVNMLTNDPIIEVEDANFNNAGHLIMRHIYTGMDLEPTMRDRTLKQLFHIWQRPVHLRTIVEDNNVIVTYTGSEFSVKKAK